jgi:hypothetical protein
MISMWTADENRPVRRLLYRVPINWNGVLWDPIVDMFKFEMNTSQPPGSLIGPLVGYGRNVVLLHNYNLPNVAETDKVIFRQPVR